MHRLRQFAALVLGLALLAMPASALTSCWNMPAMPGCHSDCAAAMGDTSARLEAPSCCGQAKTPTAPVTAAQVPVAVSGIAAPALAPVFLLPPAAADVAVPAQALPPPHPGSPQALLCSFLI